MRDTVGFCKTYQVFALSLAKISLSAARRTGHDPARKASELYALLYACSSTRDDAASSIEVGKLPASCVESGFPCRECSS